MTSRIMTFQTGFADSLALSHHGVWEYCFGKGNANLTLSLFTLYGADVVSQKE